MNARLTYINLINTLPQTASSQILMKSAKNIANLPKDLTGEKGESAKKTSENVRFIRID